MYFTPFRELVPDVADKETRTLTVLPDAGHGLPPGNYHFLELYCGEPGCDCRRVMFHVRSENVPQANAVIGWGWESIEFYKRWMKGLISAKDLATLKGPALNPTSRQSSLAPALLKLAEEVLLADPEYVERLKRHYKLFCAKRDAPREPNRQLRAKLREQRRKRKNRR